MSPLDEMGGVMALPSLAAQQGAPQASAPVGPGGMFAGRPVGRGPSAAQQGHGADLKPSMGAVPLPGRNLTYDAPDPASAGHKGLFPGKDGKTWLQLGAAAINGYLAGMGNPVGLANIQAEHQQRREMAEMAARRQAAEDEAQRKAREPRTVGSNLIQMQDDGTFQTLYNAPEPFEDYASSLGYQPGTEDYQEAVRNYRLGAWSDDAVEAKQGLTGYRFDRQGQLQDRRYDRMDDLQDKRLDVTRRGQDLSHSDRVRGQDIASRDRGAARQQRGEIAGATDRRVRESAGFRGGSGRGGRASAAGSGEVFATNAKGEKLVLRNNRWVNVTTGKVQ